MSANGQIFVLSAPSGAGKSTVLSKVRELLPDLAYSISLTTREPRPGEVDGQHYHFITRQDFESRIAAGEIAEHAEIYGNLYGTSARLLADSIDQGENLLLEIDVEGAAQLRERFPDGVYIFLLPPSIEELGRRLRSRGSEDESVIRTRLDRVAQEMTHAANYTHLVVNDDLDRAVDEVRSIIVSDTLRTKRRLAVLKKEIGF